MVVHEILDIAEDLLVALVRVVCDRLEAFAGFLRDDGGLGVEDKGDCQQALVVLSECSWARMNVRRTLIHSIWQGQSALVWFRGQDVPVDRDDESRYGSARGDGGGRGRLP